MESGALKPRLREACMDAGLPQCNTMYYCPRTRIIETKHEHGEAEARAIAAHADDSNAHDYHVTVRIGDIDIHSYILGRERMSQGSARATQGGLETHTDPSCLQMSQRDARKMLEQAAQTGYLQHENYEIMLRAEVEERLREREREDPEFVEIAQCVRTTIDDTREVLIRNSADDTGIPRGYTGSVNGAYKIMLRDGDSAAGVVLKELEIVFYKREMVLKKIRRSIRNTTLEELAQEMRSSLKTSTESTTTGLTVGKGGAPKPIRKEAKDAQAEL